MVCISLYKRYSLVGHSVIVVVAEPTTNIRELQSVGVDRMYPLLWQQPWMVKTRVHDAPWHGFSRSGGFADDWVVAGWLKCRMIEVGEIFAHIDDSAGMVRFSEDPEDYRSTEMLSQLDNHLQKSIKLASKLQSIDNGVSSPLMNPCWATSFHRICGMQISDLGRVSMTCICLYTLCYGLIGADHGFVTSVQGIRALYSKKVVILRFHHRSNRWKALRASCITFLLMDWLMLVTAFWLVLKALFAQRFGVIYQRIEHLKCRLGMHSITTVECALN